MRALIYDAAILPLTAKWYAEVLRRVPEGAHMLDVGIGTGGALAKNASLVRARRIRVTGVDIDADYVKHARKALEKAGLSDLVDVRLQSIHDHVERPYDAVYFSASFMLMPEPAKVLHHVGELLSPQGRIFFTQTFQDKRSKVLERAKPLLKRVTTIEFGRVTYEQDFRRMVARGGVELEALEVMGRKGTRSYRLAIGRPIREAL